MERVDILNLQKMKESRSIKFGQYFLVASVLLSLYGGLQEYSSSNDEWALRVDHNLTSSSEGTSVLSLQHENGNQTPENMEIQMETHSGLKQTAKIESVSNTTLFHRFEMEKELIRNVLIHSSHPLTIKSKGRVLQSVSKSKPALKSLTNIFKVFFCLARNLTLVALVSNTFNIWMPLLLFIESFLMVGMWTHDVHYITEMYVGIFHSRLDVFNFIRMTFSSNPSPSKITLLNDYGYSNKFFANVSGEVSVLLVLLVASIVIKASNIFVKSEKLRSVGSKLRPVWNGYICWMTPKLMTMAGFQFRGATKVLSGLDILNCILAALSIIGIILFIGLMIVQVRKINSKLEYIEESRLQIGFAERLDYMRDFEFDCLQYSMLHYPVMNQIRLTFSFLCVGFAPDFHYVQFGGVLAAQVFYMMMQISCSPYIRVRDKIFYPILDFFYSIYLLFLIGMGLIYHVRHFDLTIKLETFLLSMLCAIVVPQVALILADIVSALREKSKQTDKDSVADTDSELSDNKTKKKGFGGKDSKKKSRVDNDKESNLNKNLDKNNHFKAEDISDDEASVQTQNIFQDNKVKVKKIKKGKVI